MDNFDTANSESNDPSSEQTELSHTDKIAGVLSEPSSTFEKISHFPPKTVDWILPLLLAIIVFSVTQFIKMGNPEIKLQVKQQQEEALDKAVAEKKMTQDQADNQLKMMDSPLAAVFSVVGFFIVWFIFFFLMALVYFIFVKFLLKGDGSFKSILTANGLVLYISIIQIIISTVLAMLLNRLINDTSLAAMLNLDRLSYVGWLAGRLDPFTIWGYIVLSIALAKLFKSNSVMKYAALVFGIWIIGGFIFFQIARAVPFLKGLAGA